MFGHFGISAYKRVLYKRINFAQDLIYYLVQIDRSLQIRTASCKKGSLIVCLFYQFLFNKQTYLNGLRGYFHRSCNLVHIVSFGIYCSVLEREGRMDVLEIYQIIYLISNLNSVCLRFTAASWKKRYSCYISFFTNFAFIYWTCLFGFGGKFHRSYNLVHTVRDLD